MLPWFYCPNSLPLGELFDIEVEVLGKLCWPDFACISCMVHHREKIQPEFYVSNSSLQEWLSHSSSQSQLYDGGKDRVSEPVMPGYLEFMKSARGFLAFQADLASAPLEITHIIRVVLGQVCSLCIFSLSGL